MVRIEQVTLRNLPTFIDVRLRALQEAPWAFGSTYGRESQFTDALSAADAAQADLERAAAASLSAFRSGEPHGH